MQAGLHHVPGKGAGGRRMRKLILASASPRRRELLELIAPNFIVQESAVGESSSTVDPAELARLLAERKAAAVAAEREEEAVVIGADTVVYAEGEILGKPRDAADGRRMLGLLSGKTHFVYTGLCVIQRKQGARIMEVEKTAVRFARLSEEEIQGYIATGEYADKAGGYGIQGYAAKFISGIDGCYFNVVGLPVHRLYRILRELDAL